MDLEKLFKNLILLDFIVLILIVISSIYQPKEFEDIYNFLDRGMLSNFENFNNILSLSLFLLYLLTLNLLYRFISYAKNLYLILIILGLLFNFFNGSVIFTSFSGILDQIGGMLSGAILILLFFSPISNNFN